MFSQTVSHRRLAICRSGLLALCGMLCSVPSLLDAALPLRKTTLSKTTLRKTISLNGTWQFAAGSWEKRPSKFARSIPVPGVVDMATPPLANVGMNTKQRTTSPQFLAIPDPHYQAFWYRRTFSVEGEIPAVAQLKLSKAKFGTHVWLNGQDLGDHWPCFTPGYFDIRNALKGGGEENELIIRLGPSPLTVTDRAANGYDFEKKRYLAGLYDDVSLILAGSPFLKNIQVVPDIKRESIKVVAEIQNWLDEPVDSPVEFEVRPYKGSPVVGCNSVPNLRLHPLETRTVEATIPITNCRRWTPEAPHLYQVLSRTKSDQLETRFGMREFRFNPQTQIGELNGQPYFLRGSNVCFFRFEEDPNRGNKPWDESWVRTLHQRFKSLHMNTLRYCIGFPPELWYRIADEEGLIIQDEFPVWTLSEDDQTPVTVDRLASEYRDWMRAHWNHASVLIWDAQNESKFDKTRLAIDQVRSLDQSQRPWDNGWGQPHRPTDVFEDHPYQYSRSMLVADWTPELKPLPQLEEVVSKYLQLGPEGPRPRIVNEYAWLWLQRDGRPTTLTALGYRTYLPEADVEQRRDFYARHLAAMTEALRASRRVAGVLHFCGLGHSWDGCATSDNFLDLEQLQFEPHFHRYMSQAMAPVGLLLQVPDQIGSGQQLQAQVIAFNDLATEQWTRLELAWQQGDVLEAKRIDIPPFGRREASVTIAAPDEPGRYELTARLITVGNHPVASRRLVTVSAR
jgi:beta-galactosidase